MRTSEIQIEKGFHAVSFGGVVLYYSFGALIGVQNKNVLWVSENYWLGESSTHVARLKSMATEKLSVLTVALDVLQDTMTSTMRSVFA